MFLSCLIGMFLRGLVMGSPRGLWMSDSFMWNNLRELVLGFPCGRYIVSCDTIWEAFVWEILSKTFFLLWVHCIFFFSLFVALFLAPWYGGSRLHLHLRGIAFSGRPHKILSFLLLVLDPVLFSLFFCLSIFQDTGSGTIVSSCFFSSFHFDLSFFFSCSFGSYVVVL